MEAYGGLFAVVRFLHTDDAYGYTYAYDIKSNMALTGDTVSIGRTCNGCNDKGLPKLFSGKKCVSAT